MASAEVKWIDHSQLNVTELMTDPGPNKDIVRLAGSLSVPGYDNSASVILHGLVEVG
jgi:hypothetical protein